jgi:hypothetical protein
VTRSAIGRAALIGAQRSHGDSIAPAAGEYRPPAPTPAPRITPEEAARQLAADPEFVQWRAEELAADLAQKTRKVYHP